MKAIRVHETGGPEKLIYEEVPVAEPGPDQVRVKIHAIGVNFIDVYFRTGLYKASLPFIPGMEAAGTVEAVGHQVTTVAPGHRVAYAMSLGAYADCALVPAKLLIELPDKVDFQTAAALMLQGMTAHYLTHSTFPLRSGETALIHAAAGGAGLLLVQMAKMIGARVIGTVSTEEKAARAREAGADHVILYDGQGVHVVYDSVGRKTFDQSLNCLKRRGMMVLFGQSSGPVAPVDPNLLNPKGALYLTRPSLAHYTSTHEELEWRATDILSWASTGKLKIRIDRTLPLKDAAEAHRALEGRVTSGKILLIP